MQKEKSNQIDLGRLCHTTIQNFSNIVAPPITKTMKMKHAFLSIISAHQSVRKGNEYPYIYLSTFNGLCVQWEFHLVKLYILGLFHFFSLGKSKSSYNLTYIRDLLTEALFKKKNFFNNFFPPSTYISAKCYISTHV